MQQFEGRVAVVTGGASGVGKCLGAELARLDAHVVVIDIDPKRIEAACADLDPLGKGNTPLFAAVKEALRSGYLGSIAELLKAGADPELHRAPSGCHPIWQAVWESGGSARAAGALGAVRALLLERRLGPALRVGEQRADLCCYTPPCTSLANL